MALISAADANIISQRTLDEQRDIELNRMLKTIDEYIKSVAKTGATSLSLRSIPGWNQCHVQPRIIKALREAGYKYDYSSGDSREPLDYGYEDISWVKK